MQQKQQRVIGLVIVSMRFQIKHCCIISQDNSMVPKKLQERKEHSEFESLQVKVTFYSTFFDSKRKTVFIIGEASKSVSTDCRSSGRILKAIETADLDFLNTADVLMTKSASL